MTQREKYEWLVNNLTKVGKEQRGHKASCPCCNDNQQHLKFEINSEDWILMHCVKCEAKYEDVIKSVDFPKDDFQKTTERPKEQIHIYKNPDGTDSYYKGRTKYANGKKKFRFFYIENGKEIPRKPNICNNLYNLDDLEKADEGQTLYIVEGEKCADKLKEKGFLVTTGNGGCGALKLSETDQRLLDKFEDQVIIPDLDEAGSKYLEKFPNAKALDLSDIWADVTEKQDIYDFITLGHDIELIKNYQFEEDPLTRTDHTLSSLCSTKTVKKLFMIKDKDKRNDLKQFLMEQARDLRCVGEFNKLYSKLWAEEHAEEVRAQVALDAKKRGFDLICDGEGNIMNKAVNFLTILETDETLKGLWLNEFTGVPEKTVDGERKLWRDVDDNITQIYIEEKYNIWDIPKMRAAISIKFENNKKNPLKELIEATKWDGVSRIHTFLPKYCKCEDSAYTRETSRLIFAGGIHRAYTPGCKFDDVVILSGEGGTGKSTLIKWLALSDEFFGEIESMDGQVGSEAALASWIIEISELTALKTQKGNEKIKGFLTRQVEKYRQPYERHMSAIPRSCIFIGTTNEDQYLTDKTGNRRFYPVQMKSKLNDLLLREEEIKADICQCWAEALVKMNTEELKPYMNYSLIDVVREKQEEALEDDYRVAMIEKYLISVEEVCVMSIWENALFETQKKPTQKESVDIGRIMNGFTDWEKVKHVKPGRYGRPRGWKYTKTEEIKKKLDEEEQNLFKD